MIINVTFVTVAVNWHIYLCYLIFNNATVLNSLTVFTNRGGNVSQDVSLKGHKVCFSTFSWPLEKQGWVSIDREGTAKEKKKE